MSNLRYVSFLRFNEEHYATVLNNLIFFARENASFIIELTGEKADKYAKSTSS